MAVDLTLLQSELASDPTNLGYAGKSASEIASLLNDPTKEPLIPRGTILKSDFIGNLFGILDAIKNNPGLDPALKTKWNNRMDLLALFQDGVNVNDPVMDAIFSDLVTDGLLSADGKTALENRTGSRAEKLFGAGTIITDTNILQVQNPSGKVFVLIMVDQPVAEAVGYLAAVSGTFGYDDLVPCYRVDDPNKVQSVQFQARSIVGGIQ